ncbi:MAG: TrkA family potassium uptake protein [Salinivirgaceae bacterium]|nr:TrkA family potassium uptake protein [Salinivirgaceae bacterium]
MKFIVIGLGYFGSTLAISLIEQGHEVIGVDNRWNRVDELKNLIPNVMEMDTTNEQAVKTLPLDDTDSVIVAIGEDVGSSLLTLSILQNLGVKNIIGRVISPIHQNILKQIGIEHTVHPEFATAIRVGLKLQLRDAIDVFELDDNNVIAEFKVPSKYDGHTVGTMNLTQRFKLRLMAVKTPSSQRGVMSIISKNEYMTNFEPSDEMVVHESDVLVLAGSMNDMKKFAAE